MIGFLAPVFLSFAFLGRRGGSLLFFIRERDGGTCSENTKKSGFWPHFAKSRDSVSKVIMLFLVTWLEREWMKEREWMCTEVPGAVKRAFNRDCT